MYDSMKATVTLSTIATIFSGLALRESVDRLPQGPVRMVQMRDVDVDRGVSWATALSVALPGKRTRDSLRPDDILFTARGQRNAAVALNVVPAPAVCAGNLFVIRPHDPRQCLPAYVAWYINQRPAQGYFQHSATGTNILNIRRDVIAQLEIPIPAIAHQWAIVNLDAAARHERRILQRLMANRDEEMEALAARLAARKHTTERARS